MENKIYGNDLFEMPQEERIIMHVDMNSYFASCEQQANPAWRGRPLGVCSYIHPKGTIIAASKEAKQLGIKTGTKVWEARQMCPDIVLVRDDPTKYRIITERIQAVFNSYTNIVENYSIDESFLCFEGEQCDIGVCSRIADQIKRRITEEVGEWLTCSIGIAGTKFFAKLGSDFKKPDGLVIINNENVDNLLRQLDLMDVWGISYGLKKQLNVLGIFKPLEIKYAKPSFLLDKMGKMGYFLWSRLNGLEVDRLQINEEKKPKSVGHSYTLLKKTASKDEIALLLMKMAEKTGRRLRKKNMRAKILWIGWKYVYGGGFGRQEKLVEATDDSWDIFEGAFRHLQRKILHDKISKIYISVSGLEMNDRLQLSIFEDKLKKIRLVESMDEINDKYGEFTVSRGAWRDWSEEISDRVSFGKM
jgi:DNA polymerase-4